MDTVVWAIWGISLAVLFVMLFWGSRKLEAQLETKPSSEEVVTEPPDFSIKHQYAKTTITLGTPP